MVIVAPPLIETPIVVAGAPVTEAMGISGFAPDRTRLCGVVDEWAVTEGSRQRLHRTGGEWPTCLLAPAPMTASGDTVGEIPFIVCTAEVTTVTWVGIVAMIPFPKFTVVSFKLQVCIKEVELALIWLFDPFLWMCRDSQD